ncbi:glycosyltransferase family 4 protein [Flavobacterium caseinilyticum]|uniref:Glycosyltransferase family 1 protein n=1 Tax=Flavobacterium caseinilyticum TaxID=2541732 RepID=A0A4R5AV22_9FLAO|nr:glycosyltransferase family 4 protein [Flavobacterium caseinilyticum]TDD75940.1 glycosyltransferase family 1 protein [Flavobacterium caseinilyticum]
MKVSVRPKIIRTATVALSLNYLLRGQLAFLNGYYDVIAVSGADDDLMQVAAREKVSTIGIEMQRKISPLKDLKSLWQLYWLFKKEKPLIVHSITPKAGLLTMMAGYLAGVPIRIHTFTGLIFPTRKGMMQKLLIFTDRILCYCATNIYPEGQGVKSDLISYKITTKKLQVLANGNVNGTDTMYFDSGLISTTEKQHLKTSLGIAADDFVFIFIGRLVGDKGINELIQAFQQLCGESAAVKLLLVGPFEADLDPLRPETLQLINSNQQILPVGFQQDVRPYFAISDCLAFPSHREGFPNVVLQAGAMGLPSIVTNINGCNEIITEGQNGVIIPVNDSFALYKAMKKIVTDDAFRLQLEQHARRMIVSRYEQQVVWDAILAEYKALEQKAGY